MKKRIISAALAAMLVMTSVMLFAGCGGDGEYPVVVANIEIKEEPKNIVVLDANTADIIECIGYEIKMVGRSDSVDQESLSVAPSVGSASNPDVQSIIDLDTDVVFADDTLDSNAKQKLEDNGITVVRMTVANTPEHMKTSYITIGKVLGGNTAGAKKGEDAYNNLLADMQKIKDSATAIDNSGVLSTVCYLYYEKDVLRFLISGTYGDMLLGYTGCVNVAVNVEESSVPANTLSVANPNYIFYADEETLNVVKADATLSQLAAIKENKTMMITHDEMNRQGYTAISTLNKMVGFIHPELAVTSTADEASAASASNAQTATTSVADKYGVKLDGLSLEYEQENDNVKAMQQRLYDLGYVDDAENITGYYGDISKQAVSDFQKNNGLEETGTADNKTLEKLFSDEAVKAK